MPDNRPDTSPETGPDTGPDNGPDNGPIPPLTRHLLDRIAQDGPLRLSDYMADCLLHPRYGYYTTRDPLGAAGDFTTAPEISQMFGELIGLSLAQSWLDQGAPSPFTLAELGPGRGTLMADILRATRGVPGFHAAMTLLLVEVSPTLRRAQKATLKGQDVAWRDRLGDMPDAPLFLVANEFFDALPIRQFVRADDILWQERRVTAQGTTLTLGLTGAAPEPALAHRLGDTKPGDIVETCPAASAIAAQIGDHIARHGGAALIVDYGDWRSQGDTLQALRNHAYADPLADPGQSDLTAHVDFEDIATAAAPACHSLLTPQGVFLERLGITARAQALAARLTDDALSAHVAAHRRLTHPQEMGTLFKTLALYPKGHRPPPGLEPAKHDSA
ncbi:class I SAM-dependent methyltransferase [Pseudooceanicola sediminis]|uniref:Class I SAM-dependent methyltransferase n=1 Tax=Pseudooceanicola sediminis TaxID=2211117 RepID=A0A399J0W9_9RHOB|nr:SAM-dependent methyltransferase [Pseudooceanicola sediminis]KAA2315176.1 class I SAM-dependent methyltransferase [Puniceibacterium sp. HSS470]RII39063.1 class I SAM-dependent methyltransferase [Pseudooceanicola sediminis]